MNFSNGLTKVPAKNPKNKAATLPEQSLALIHGDDDFAVFQRARQVYQGWCEDAGGMECTSYPLYKNVIGLRSTGR